MRTKREIKLYLWIVCFTILCGSSCSDGKEILEQTTPTPDSETPQPDIPAVTEGNYTLTSTATLLDSTAEKAISVVEERTDGSTVLSYPAGQTLPAIGEVLLSGGYGTDSPFPNGFMGKVTAVTKKDDTFLVTTVPAALTEAFTELNVDTSFNLLPQITESRAVSLETTEDEEGFQNFTIEVSDDALGLEGRITLGLRLLCVVDLQNQSIRNATFTLDSKLKTDYTVSLHEEVEKEVKVPIGQPIPLGSLWIPNTPFRITPELQLYLYITAEGKASVSLGMTYEQGMSSFVRLHQGKWESGIRFREGENDGRFLTASKFSLQGECVEGVSVAVDCKINHSSIVAVGLEASAGCKQEGVFDTSRRGHVLETGYVMVYDEALMHAAINCSMVADLQATASASFFDLEYEGSYQIPGCSLETEPIQLHLFPDLGTPQYSLDVEKQTVTIEVPYSPTALLSAETSLEIHLFENGGPNHSYSSPVAISDKIELSCSENTSLTFTFSNLEGEFSIYPVIRCPIVANSEKKTYPIYNESHNPVTFEQSGDGAMLMKFYRNNGGEQWKRQDNWGSNLPLNEWYGVDTRKGRVSEINLKDNGVTGKVDLRGDFPKLVSLDLRNNPITDVNVSGLKSLVTLEADECTKLKNLDASDCTNLKNIYYCSERADYNGYCDLDSINISNTAIKSIGNIIYRNLFFFKATGCRNLEVAHFYGKDEQDPPFSTEVGTIILHDNPQLGETILRFFKQIHTLDIQDNENLTSIYIRNNPFTLNLDPHINNFILKNCENLKSLNIHGSTVDNWER